MTNIDNFKTFVKRNPKLTTHIKNGNMTWQKFYELYDLYGEDNEIWKEYISNSTSNTSETPKSASINSTFSNIINIAKNLDANKVQDGITSIQKAISLFGDILLKDKPDSTNTYSPRPIYRRFDD